MRIDETRMETLTEKVESVLRRITPRNAVIVTERLGAEAPMSVREISRRTGLTKQRIHELEKTTRGALEPELGDAVKRLMTLLMGRDGTRTGTTDAAFARTLAVVAPGESGAARIARRTIEHASPLIAVNGMRVSRVHETIAENVPRFARRYANAAGVITDTAPLRAALPDDWLEHWEPWFVESAGMTILNGYWVVRRTKLSRVHTTLMVSGEPLTADDIADRTGLELKEVRGALHARKGTEKVDALRWTTTERVAEAYTSVSRLMNAEIERAGGEIAFTELARHLRKWGVAERTVDTASRSLMFERRGEAVRLRDPATIRAGNVTDAMHGMDSRKRPYWTFPATRRYLQGYSLTFLPTAIAVALGCPPGGMKMMRLKHPGGLSEASICWRLSNNKNATLGRLKNALAAAAAEPGQRIRIAIDESRGLELSINDPNDGVETATEHAIRVRERRRRAAGPAA